jgi:hypothetical protein
LPKCRCCKRRKGATQEALSPVTPSDASLAAVAPKDAPAADGNPTEKFQYFQEEFVLPVGGIILGFKKAQRDHIIKECMLYCAFVLAFVSVTMMVRPVHTTFTIQQGIYVNLGLEAIDPSTINFSKDFYGIANYGDFWKWVNTVLYFKAYECCYYNSDSLNKVYGDTNDFVIAKYNRLLTPIRFRQARSTMDSCSNPATNHQLARPCWPEHSGATEETADIFGSARLGSSSDSKFITDLSGHTGDGDDGEEGGYGTSAHVVDLDLDAGKALEKIKGMIKERWTDEWTRAIAIDLNMYNQNYDMATVFRFKIDQVVGGHLFPKVEAKSCRLNPYTSSMDYFRATIEALWAVLLIYHFYVEIKEFMNEGFFYYFSNLWNIIELTNLVTFLVIMSNWIDYVLTDRSAFKLRNVSEFHDLYSLCSQFTMTANLAAFNSVWCFIKLFKYLQFYTRFLLIWDVLAHSMTSIQPFLGVMMLIFFAFSFSGYWLFGARVYEFHTWPMALNFLLRSIIEGLVKVKKGVQIDLYKPMKEASPGAAPVWACGWVIMSSLIFLNMFIAILTDSYVYIQQRTKHQDEAERAFLMPAWLLYFRSKVPCLWKDPDMKEKVMNMRNEEAKLRKHLASIDQVKLWQFTLDSIADGNFDLEVSEMMQFFPHKDEFESYRLTVEWMHKFSDYAGIRMRRTEQDHPTLAEIALLIDKVSTLEEEISGLASQLQKVDTLKRKGAVQKALHSLKPGAI